MPFVYKPEFASSKQQKKMEEAAKRREEVFNKHPEIAELDRIIKEKEFKFRGARFHGLDEKKRSNLGKEIKELKEEYQKLLTKYDIPPDFKEPKWDCLECKDKGEVLTPRGYVPCSCRQETDTHYLKRQSGIPPRFARASFEEARLDLYPAKNAGKDSPRIKAEKAYQAGREFVQAQLKGENCRGLLIDGPSGSGKTYLLSCIANELIARGKPVRYISYNDFLYMVRISFAPDSPYSEYELLQEIENVPVLILDDLGTEQATDFSSSLLYRIIDKRYGKNLPFLLSTSCSLEKLEKRLGFLGNQIMQRIIETCGIQGLKGNIRTNIMDKEQGKNG